MNTYDVFIVGGGVSGTALLYQLARFTDLKNIALAEKYEKIAIVNSKSSNNSQTIHCGDIETNYTYEKARTTKRTAGMVINYASKLPADERDNIIHKYSKMVLGVGKVECDALRERFQTFKTLYPNLREMEREEIARVEPKVVEGRSESEEIFALGSTNEYTAANYNTLSESLVHNARQQAEKRGATCGVMMSTPVTRIERVGDLFQIHTENQGVFEARYVVVSAGGHSLLFAHSMGYGLDKSCLPMAGSYYFTPQVLNGKVYTVQNPNLPFAAIHGDPDVAVPGKTRFGPTALVLPELERYNQKTFFEFLKVLRPDGAVFKALWDLVKVRDIRNYIGRNVMYEIPFLRERLFLKEVQKIIPSLMLDNIKFARHFGGIRPQIIDKTQKKLLMGEAKINPGNGIVFNMTPSPGGTSCLGNAEKDMYLIAKYLGCHVDEQAFAEEMLSGEVELREIKRPDAHSLAEV